MEAKVASFAFEQPLLLDDLLAYMDGGSVVLKLLDSCNQSFSVEFVQRMSLQKYPFANTPGSFLLNNVEVPVRSGSEKILLTALRSLRFKDSSPADQTLATKEWIHELVDFVESDEYLRIAALMGRI